MPPRLLNSRANPLHTQKMLTGPGSRSAMAITMTTTTTTATATSIFCPFDNPLLMAGCWPRRGAAAGVFPA